MPSAPLLAPTSLLTQWSKLGAFFCQLPEAELLHHPHIFPTPQITPILIRPIFDNAIDKQTWNMQTVNTFLTGISRMSCSRGNSEQKSAVFTRSAVEQQERFLSHSRAEQSHAPSWARGAFSTTTSGGRSAHSGVWVWGCAADFICVAPAWHTGCRLSSRARFRRSCHKTSPLILYYIRFCYCSFLFESP